MSNTIEQSPGEQRAQDRAQAANAERERVAAAKAPPHDDAGSAQAAADEAQAKADAARAAAEAKAAQAAKDAQDRADAIEAARPQWQTIHSGPMDSTERLVMPGGYLIRSTWRAVSGRQGADPLDGNSMVFVEGDAPVLPNPRVLILAVADVLPNVDPANARLEDVQPIRQIITTPEVLLALPDGKVRVLKSRDASAVGTVRALTPADGVVA